MRRSCLAFGIVLWSAWTAQAPTTLKTGDNLQAAINAAKPGQTILLEPGARFVGNFTLPPKPGGATITIRSSATLPERRITEADAPLLPIIASGTPESALRATGATNWTFDGVQFESNVGGHGAIIELEHVAHVTFDRMLIVAGATGQKRAVLGNGKHVTLTRSHIANIWTPGADSQCFLAYDGAGPYTITDNYLECASENIMFGGADSSAADRVSADIHIEGNDITKRLEWRGQGKNVKNLIELKAGKRVTIRRNTLRHSWTDGQDGWAIVLTPRNQGGLAPWSTVEDVTIDSNLIEGVERGVQMLGVDDVQPSGRLQRVTIRNNRFVTSRDFLVAGGEVGAFTLANNTIENGALFLKFFAGEIRPTGETKRPARFAIEAPIIQNNLARATLPTPDDPGGYSIFGDGGTPGLPSLEQYAPGFVWGTNVIVGGATWLKYPAGTLLQLPADLSQLGAQGAIGSQPTPMTPDPPTQPAICQKDPLVILPGTVRWPSKNTGTRSITFNTGGKPWSSFAFDWETKTLTVSDHRRCVATVVKQP
jgi:Right handed beta helix region